MLLRPEVLLEKRQQRLFRLFGIRALEAVFRALKRQQFHLHPSGLQTIPHPNRLLVSDVLILRALQQERRRGMRRDPVQRA